VKEKDTLDALPHPPGFTRNGASRRELRTEGRDASLGGRMPSRHLRAQSTPWPRAARQISGRPSATSWLARRPDISRATPTEIARRFTGKRTNHPSVAKNAAIDSSLIDQAVGAERGRGDSNV
jgi:hypothetical protein